MAGRQLLDICVDRARRVDVLELQIFANRIDADGPIEARDFFEGLQFGGEGKAAAQDIRALSESLRENPGQLLYQPRERGVEIPR